MNSELRDRERAGSQGVPAGFLWGAGRAGIKASGNLDVAIARAPRGASGVACFTRNQVVAAPVTVGRRHLLATGGRVAAVLVNAGNANCATGQDGMEGCLATCVAAAETFGCLFDEVFPSSTGIIGVPFPAQKLIAALPAMTGAMGATVEDAEMFAEAILTTDTKRKLARAVIDVDGTEVRLLGVCKGAGMIHPRLGAPVAVAGPAHATMLVYLFTDLAAEVEDLNALLGAAVERSFNRISIDGDTSTNDTVLLLASGASGVRLEPVGERVRTAFAEALGLVCGSLAYQIVEDGEGVGHVVTLEITGAATEEDARRVAEAIATSPLCKTAWSSGDPNWGRMLAAAGRSGVDVEAERMTIEIGSQLVFARGMRSSAFDEAAAHAVMEAREYTIHLDLGMGAEGCRFVTCDLTAEYVRINADYST